MRSYMLIGPFKCSHLRSRVRELGPVCGPLVLRSTNPLLPTLRFSVIKIQIYHSRRLKGEERDSKSRRKKHGAVFPPCVQLQVLLNWPSCDDRRCTARRRLFQKKKALNSGEKNTPFAHYLMIEQTLISLAFISFVSIIREKSAHPEGSFPRIQQTTQ